MIGAIGSLLVIALAVPATGQTTQASGFVSPCPHVFMYDPLGTEPGKWYGVVNVSTDTTLFALWLNIVLESKADILGNWIGEVTTDDNMDFKIENTKMTVNPGPPMPVRFFIQYNPLNKIPKLKAIRLNGREICNIEPPQVVNETTTRPASNGRIPARTDITTSTIKPTVTTSRNIVRQQTTKSQYWTQTKEENIYQQKPDNKQQITLNSKPQYWQQSTSENKTLAASKPQVWSHVIGENKSDGKVTGSDGGSQTIKVQPAVQNWSQTTNNNNQPTRTEIKAQAENKSTPTRCENTSQVKNKNKSLTVEPLVWPRYDEAENQSTNCKGRQQTRTENTSQSKVIQPVIKTQFWPKIPKDDNQPKPHSHQSTRVESKFVIDDTSNIQPYVQKKVASNSFIIAESSSQITTDDRYQSKDYEKVKASPVDSSQSLDQSRQSYPIYVRPESKQPQSVETLIAKDNLQTRGDLQSSPVRIQGAENQSWSKERTSNRDRVEFESAGEQPTGYSDLERSGLPLDGHHLTTTSAPPANIRRQEDTNNNQKPDYDNDYVIGGLPTIYIPNHPLRRTQPQCGRVLLDKDNVSYGRGTASRIEGQWPWQIALYQQRTAVDSKYICGGTLVSRNHVITAAHCVTRTGQNRVVNKNTLTVYLGKHNLRTSVDGVQVKFVNKIVINPEYNATTFSRDLAILELKEPVTYSDWVQPACLWPDNEKTLSSIVGKKGSVVGWGFDPSGTPREELNLVEMPVVDQKTCVRSYSEFYRKFTSDYTYCAGYGDDTSMCSSDSGGGMVFKKGNNWYLRGLASLSVARRGNYLCDPSHYVIFTDIAQFLPWIEDNIDDY